MLIHEMTIFYCPLFVLLLGSAYARQNRILQWLLITGGLFAISLITVFIFSGDPDMRQAIFSSWAHRYPELTNSGGLAYVGRSFLDNTAKSFAHHTNFITLGSFFMGFLLSALPLVFLWHAYRPDQAVRTLLSDSKMLRFLFWPAVLAPFSLSAITTDFGRNISITFMSYLFFLYAIASFKSMPETPWLRGFKEAISASSRLRYAIYLFAIVYGLGWRMVHNQPPGKSYVTLGGFLYLF
jgi:hypothetical protein